MVETVRSVRYRFKNETSGTPTTDEFETSN
jgi:hypothetical protein